MAPFTPFGALVETLKPGATGRDLVQLLDGRAERTLALHWKAGRCGPPAWAVDLLKDKLRRRHERERAIAEQAKPGVGLKAGARNLAEWKARRV